MRIGACSDVHGRRDRLLTVLGAMAAAGVNERWCLGDLVGSEPVTPELVGAARQLDLLIAGNHDAWALGPHRVTARGRDVFRLASRAMASRHSDLEDARRRFRFLIRNRDTKFMAGLDAVLASVGIETTLTPVASPRANAFAERLVRTVREDCLDHLLVVSRRHLEMVLADYVRHYNAARPHRGLRLEQPIPRAVQSGTDGGVIRRDILGGLIHEYERAA